MANEVNLYTIYDRLAEEAGPIFHAKNDAVALRAAKNLLKDVANAADYVLHHIGFFDTKESCLIPLETVSVVEDSIDE